MFGFDGELSGIESILTRIAMNNGSGAFTHKEVRAYARCILKMLPELNVSASNRRHVLIMEDTDVQLVLLASTCPDCNWQGNATEEQILKLVAIASQFPQV